MGLVFRKSMKKNRGGICRNIPFGKILIFSLIISVFISIYIVYIALDHNPQSSYCASYEGFDCRFGAGFIFIFDLVSKSDFIEWGNLFLLALSWFFASLLILFIVSSMVLCLVRYFLRHT